MASEEHAETLAGVGEFAVIDRLVSGRDQPPSVAVGPGDDAAVVAAGDGDDRRLVPAGDQPVDDGELPQPSQAVGLLLAGHGTSG